MIPEELKDFIQKLDEVIRKLLELIYKNEIVKTINPDSTNFPELVDELYRLEEEAFELKECYCDHTDILEDLINKIKKVKVVLDLYDPEMELDRMFPDRHDDDFDEDSISWGSTFWND